MKVGPVLTESNSFFPSVFLSCLDLRRPRSEPSSYYSSECQRDLPAAKKHKPNPEAAQTRPNKAASVPLSLEHQQLHKLSTNPNTLPAETPSAEQNTAAEGTKTGGISQAKLSSFRTGGHKWSSREVYRKVSGGGGGSSLGKEKLVTRLRQRGENLSMMTMTDREIVDTELLTYKEDLENQDCLSHMEDLQVSNDLWALFPLVWFTIPGMYMILSKKKSLTLRKLSQ